MLFLIGHQKIPRSLITIESLWTFIFCQVKQTINFYFSFGYRKIPFDRNVQMRENKKKKKKEKN